MRRWLFNLATAVSLVVCAATAVCWVIGVLPHSQVRAWRCRASPQRSWFIRLARQHLIVSKQQMVPQLLPAPYAVDSTCFGSFKVSGADLAAGGLTLGSDSFELNPENAWFRRLRTPVGNIKIIDRGGNVVVVGNFYEDVAIPWWSLLVLFAMLPSWWLLTWHRARARLLGGLCLACGYDLRGTPERCPECGAVPGAVPQVRGQKSEVRGQESQQSFVF